MCMNCTPDDDHSEHNGAMNGNGNGNGANSAPHYSHNGNGNGNGNGANSAPHYSHNGNGNGAHSAPKTLVQLNLAPMEEPNLDNIDDHGPPFLDSYEETEIFTGDAEQYQKLHDAVYDLLDAFNVNWEDPNYTDTPKRVAKAYLEYWANGYGREPEDEITVFPNSSGSDDLVMVKDMRYYSMCSHHLAPFHGYAAIAYLPGKSLLGLSKLGRILNIYARRFQLQERIGAQTADKLMELLTPQGVMVVLYDTEHMCMSSRGVQLHEANTTTIAARGVFKEDATLRREILSQIRRS